MVPAADCGDDLVGIGSPDEGLWIIVGFGEEAIDGGLEVDDRAEDAAFQASVCEICAVSLDSVEPARRGGGEVEDAAGMAAEHGTALRVVVNGDVVAITMDELDGRNLGCVGVSRA